MAYVTCGTKLQSARFQKRQLFINQNKGGAPHALCMCCVFLVSRVLCASFSSVQYELDPLVTLVDIGFIPSLPSLALSKHKWVRVTGKHYRAHEARHIFGDSEYNKEASWVAKKLWWIQPLTIFTEMMWYSFWRYTVNSNSNLLNLKRQFKKCCQFYES